MLFGPAYRVAACCSCTSILRQLELYMPVERQGVHCVGATSTSRLRYSRPSVYILYCSICGICMAFLGTDRRHPMYRDHRDEESSLIPLLFKPFPNDRT